MNSSGKLGLGTVQFGLPYGISNEKGQTSSQEVRGILHLAKQKGIEVLDSASAYGNAEEVLGRNNLRDFKIVSKFMPPSAGGGISRHLGQSLQKLKIPALYAYLAHRPLELLKSPGQWEELEILKNEGKVGKIGFSLNEPEELEKLLDNGFMPDLVQVPYNYFDRRFEKDIIKLKNAGCEIHTRSAFLQGLFFIKPGDLDGFFEEVKPILGELQGQHGSLPGKLLKFAMEKPFIDKVIIGVESERQLFQNIKDIKDAADLPKLKQKISNEILIPSGWPKS